MLSKLTRNLDDIPLERRHTRLEKKKDFPIDWINPLCMLALMVFGTFFIYSAQLSYTDYGDWKKQIFWIFMGSIVYVMVGWVRYRVYMQLAPWLYLLSLIILSITLTPLGIERFGAKRWLDLGFMYFQPTEIAKIGTLLLLATILSQAKLENFKESRLDLIKVAIVLALPILIIFLQPDLGSALVFPPMLLGLLYISKLSKRFFLVVLSVGLLGLSIVSLDIYLYKSFMEKNELSFHNQKGEYEKRSWLPLRDYQRNRILGMVAPRLVDPSGTDIAWNRDQSLIAVASGGLTGKGWAQGPQSQLGYLPQSVAHNDFIFSVIAEEKGLLGSLFILGTFSILLANTLRIATLAQDSFGMLLSIGVFIIFLVHILVNIGMTIGMMPITGLPLPFLSYGGSFLVSCCILQGLVQSVSRYRKEFR